MENKYTTILSYVDRRFGEGKVYEKNGFIANGTSAIDYWYTDGDIRHNRFKFRARKGKTEKQVVIENNVSRVYGCGNQVYLFELNLLNR
jgi:hypothetical protein